MAGGKPKGNHKSDRARAATRKATAFSTASFTRNQYLNKFVGLKRIRQKPTSFVPCQNTNAYNRPWAPPAVTSTAGDIQVNLATGNNTNSTVEKLGEEGAKWYISNQLLGKTIEDGKAPFKAGYFYNYSGAHTFDVVYVDAANEHVYVIEAKGTKKGAKAELSTRQNGKTQGTWDYLNEVADEMANSGDALKMAAAAKIKNAPPGKLHYIGVHTTYSTDAKGKVSANVPKVIEIVRANSKKEQFNYKR